jgi:hypothetical protein
MPALPSRIWKKGEVAIIELDGEKAEGVVILAAPNAVSLALEFEAIIGGYAGMMPVLWDVGEGVYRGLVCGRPVKLTAREALS